MEDTSEDKGPCVHYEDADFNEDARSVALDCKIGKTDQNINVVPTDSTKSWSKNNPSFSSSDPSSKSSFIEESSSFSTLTASNIARHNHEHQKKRTLSSRQSSSSKRRTASSTLTSTLSGKSLEV